MARPRTPCPVTPKAEPHAARPPHGACGIRLRPGCDAADFNSLDVLVTAAPHLASLRYNHGMSAPPVPPALHEIGDRPFSFYPPIIGIEHNEWSYRRATWSEILVYNPATNSEIWIPRRFIGEVSRIDEPVVIVGLQKELEYRAGTVLTHERRVLTMPAAVNAAPRVPGEPALPPPSPASQGSVGTESKLGKMLLIAIVGGILICVALIAIMRQGHGRVAFTPVMQSELGLTNADDYYSVVNRLGPPADDRWRSAEGQLQYRLLAYPKQNVSILLMGADRKDMHYVGAVDQGWHVVNSINSDMEAMLRTLKRF